MSGKSVTHFDVGSQLLGKRQEATVGRIYLYDRRIFRYIERLFARIIRQDVIDKIQSSYYNSDNQINSLGRGEIPHRQ